MKYLDETCLFLAIIKVFKQLDIWTNIQYFVRSRLGHTLQDHKKSSMHTNQMTAKVLSF